MDRNLTVYSPREVHEILGLSLSCVYAIFRQETFPSIRIGKRYFVTDQALRDWLHTYEGKVYYI